jgi:cell wall-associated NlpC family hydrolase
MKYTYAQLKQLWIRAGGSAYWAPVAAAIAKAESGGNPSTINRNTNGSIDRGLWQINSVHGNLSTTNPLANAKAAVKISNNGTNWDPWSAFSNGSYEKYLKLAGNPVPKSNGKFDEFVKILKGVFGTPYLWGGKTPVGFDCSGLVTWAFKQIGVTFTGDGGATSIYNSPNVRHLKTGEALQPGDLLFYHSSSDAPGSMHHVAIYIGNGKTIQAQQSGTKVGVFAVQPGYVAGRVMKRDTVTNIHGPAKWIPVFGPGSSYSTANIQGRTNSDPNNGVGLGDMYRGVKAVGEFVSNLGERSTWIRVVKVIGGTAAVGGGMYLMFREVGIQPPNVLNPMGVSGKVAQRAVGVAKYAMEPDYVDTVKVHTNVEGYDTIRTRKYKSKKKGDYQEVIAHRYKDRKEPPVQRHAHTYMDVTPAPPKPAQDTLAKKRARARRRTRAGWWGQLEANE